MGLSDDLEDICPVCEGTGLETGNEDYNCFVCGGSGLVPEAVAGDSFMARVWRWKRDAIYAGGIGHPHYVRAESGRYSVVESSNGWKVVEHAIAEGAVHVALFKPGRRPELLAEWRDGKRVN